jgi:hypothetical protein
MKHETMKKKVNALILTGKTKFRKGDKYHLINPKIHDELFDFLHHYQCVNHLTLTKLTDNLIKLIGRNDNDEIVISGLIEVY